MAGGMHGRRCSRGACMAGDMHDREHAWQGACIARGMCVVGACIVGVYMAGCIHGRGCMLGGACGGGACMVGSCMTGAYLVGGIHSRENGNCSRQYTSFWNAFLFYAVFSKNYAKQ